MLHKDNIIQAPNITSASDVIKETMQYHHIKTVDLAKDLNLSTTYLNNFFQHKAYLNRSIAKKIGSKLHISPQLLLNLDATYRKHN